jgi:putative zinc finger/helix-turn-helix YgiT family protein
MQLPCPRCGTTRDVDIVEREEKVTIRGREVPFTARFSRCMTCGEEFEAPGQLDANLDAAREAYARLYEAPKPEELVALRTRYGASQKAFSIILGFGELTMNSYENGATPDSTNRLLLKLAAKPYIFKEMYTINKNRIGAIQRRRIEASKGFQSVMQWDGLEALSASLTALQREKIEACADQNGLPVSEQIARYVGCESFQDYSRLYAEAQWTNGTTRQIPGAFVPVNSALGAA